jgi:ABC-type lipoprotein release transport system permease subunit
MKAILAWMAAEARSRWRSWLGLALVVGIAGGIVIASAAGARRTDSAYPRFLTAQRAAHVTLLDDGSLGVQLDVDVVARLPQVASVARGSLIFYSVQNNAAVAAADGLLGTQINRFRVISGRTYDPTKMDEVVVGFAVARRLHLSAGSSFPLIDPQFVKEAAAAGISNITLRVVGIIAAPGEFPPQYTGLYPSIHMSPAFYRRYGNEFTSITDGRNAGTLFIRLKHGERDVASFKRAVESLTPGQPAFLQTATEAGVLTRRAFHFQAVALWLLAAFGGVALTLVVGQALTRQTILEATDFPILRSLGMGQTSLWIVGLLRSTIIGAAGAAIGAIVATALSPIAPFGDARIAEPHPGLAFDATAIGLGCAMVIVLAVAVSTYPAWRAARFFALSPATDSTAAPSTAARAAVRAGLPVTVVAGARLALERGYGRTAVPVRSSLGGIMIGIAVLAGSLTFGASLDHLLDTPELFGAKWDAFITNYGAGPDVRTLIDKIGSMPGISAFSVGSDGIAEIGAETVQTLAVRTVRGDAIPPIVKGRAPARPDEIALGGTTFRRMHAHLGSSIPLRVPFGEQKPIRFTVVGRTVFPPSGGVATGPGEGVLLTLEGQGRLAGSSDPRFTAAGDVLLQFAPGADRSSILNALDGLIGGTQSGEGTAANVPVESPADVVNFGRVQNFPLLLGAIIGAIATMTLAHTVISSVRRRRSDLAILKTLGVIRRQVRGIVAWQASILTAVALLIGLPVGVIAGRWGWSLFADRLGIVPEAAVDFHAVLLIVPGGLLLANAIAASPGRTAARLRPAAVLRTE